MSTEIQFELMEDGDPDIYEGPTLHKRDSKGKHRVWRMQLDSNGHYRTIAGLADGKQTETKWTVPVPKSKDTVKDQGEFEVRAKYKHQLDREYHATADTIDTPKMIEPMLAKTYKAFQAGNAQPKLDGIRCIMTKDGMFSRQGQPITAVPHLHAAAKPLFDENPDAILDGELYNHQLRNDFGKISSVVRKKNPTPEALELAEKIMEYHIYDMVDPTNVFYKRFQNLWEMLGKLDCGWLIPVPTVPVNTEEEYDEFYATWVGAGFEGGMLRPHNDPGYQLGSRSKFLLKRKDFMTEEFDVAGVEAGKGNWAGAAKRFILKNRNGEGTFGAGVRGSLAEMTKVLEGPLPAQVTLRFFEYTPDGVPRFPVVIDIHHNGRQD